MSEQTPLMKKIIKASYEASAPFGKAQEAILLGALDIDDIEHREEIVQACLDSLVALFEAEAQDARDRAYKNFTISNPDDLLTPIKSDSATLLDARAEWADNEFCFETTGLYEGERRVAAELKKGEHGYYWFLNEKLEASLVEKRGKPFLPSNSNSRILKSLGLEEKREWAPSDGPTLKTWYNCCVVAVHKRSGCRWGLDSEPVT